MHEYRTVLPDEGTIMLPAGELFSAEEITQLEWLYRAIPEERVVLGDAGEPNDLYVSRFMIDQAGELPTLVNRPQADEVLVLLRAPKRETFFHALLGSERYIRRCQVNRLVSGSFVGYHLDVDSNPDYDVSVVVQLGREFTGGEFVVYPTPASENVFAPTHGTVIISKCVYPHEVRRVTSGERISLVYFLSEYTAANRRPS